jgi:hypothetical protein
MRAINARKSKAKAEQWCITTEGIDAKAIEHKLQPLPGENYGQFKDRIFKRISELERKQ